MLDLTGYKLTFDDEFTTLSVSATGRGTVWADTRPLSILHPGVDSGFGQSAFVDPALTGIQPFAVANGALKITAAPATGAAASLSPQTYTSGLLQSMESFSQTFGYFEMRAQLPGEPGTWPAFWLLAANGHWPPELDVVETYGAEPTALVNSVHSATTSLQQVWTSQASLVSGFHTFGALWTAQTITFYFDGNAIGKIATPSDMLTAMYPVISLAMSNGSFGSASHTMQVDYVRVFSSDAAAVAVPLGTVSSPDGATTADLHGATAIGYVAPAAAAVGSDTLTIHISGDSWNGAPYFTLTVDGKGVGGVFDVTALHALGQSQDITVHGDFGTGAHQVAITYVNDANKNPYYDAATNSFVNDRNLFVSGIALDGTEYGRSAVVSNGAAFGYEWLDTHAAVMAGNGTVVFSTASSASATTPVATTPVVTTPVVTTTPTVTTTPAATTTTTTGSDTLTVHISGDSWNGPPRFSLAVDGKAVDGTVDVTALHALGQSQDVTVHGSFGSGTHQVAITYLNDANQNAYYDAPTHSFVNDRNLFVSGVAFNGTEHGIADVTSNTAASGFQWLDTHAAVMAGNGTVVFSTATSTSTTTPVTTPVVPTPVVPTPVVPTPTTTGSDTLTVHISGDSWNGPPRFSLAVDGKAVDGVYDVAALHALGQSQDVVVHGSFGSGAHQVAITYLNDANQNAYYDAPTHSFVNDRNLFVSGVAFNGTEHGIADVTSNTAASGFQWLDTHAAVMAGNGTVVFDHII